MVGVENNIIPFSSSITANCAGVIVALKNLLAPMVVFAHGAYSDTKWSFSALPEMTFLFMKMWTWFVGQFPVCAFIGRAYPYPRLNLMFSVAGKFPDQLARFASISKLHTRLKQVFSHAGKTNAVTFRDLTYSELGLVKFGGFRNLLRFQFAWRWF